MQINISCDVECQLNCVFCLKHVHSIKLDIVTIQQYEKLIEKLSKIGYDEFTLTPNTGDSFLIPNFYEIANMLENNDKVKTWSISTNLISVDTKYFDKIFSWKKCSLEISIYGFNKKSYDKLTDTNDKWQIFEKNLNDILEYVKKTDIQNFYCLDFLLRCEADINSKTYKSITSHIKNNIYFVDDSIKNCNWGGLLYDKKTCKPEICFNSLYEIIVNVNGDLKKCIWDYTNKSVFANIFKDDISSIFSLNGAYHKSLFNTELCENCNDYKSIRSDVKNFNNVAYNFKWLNFIRKDYKIYNFDRSERCL